MKIKKFNEEKVEQNLSILYFKFDNNNVSDIIVFQTDKDMENYMINVTNDELIKEDHLDHEKIKGVKFNSDDEPVFIKFIDAVNWYQDFFECDVIYEEAYFYKDIELENGVKTLREADKYNL